MLQIPPTVTKLSIMYQTDGSLEGIACIYRCHLKLLLTSRDSEV